MTVALHMVEMVLSVPELAVYARERGLTAQDVAMDPGYLVHAWLAEVFGSRGPAVFRITNQTPVVRVLAYSVAAPQELLDTLNFNATPSVARVLVGATIAGKRMPQEWATGSRLAFEVLATPTVRSGNRTVDAFLSACNHSDNVGKKVDRRAVYDQWLARKIGDAAVVERVEQAQYSLESHVRKTGKVGEPGRGRYFMRIPKVLYRGELTVASAEAFAALLARGIGRETPFGYGMLLVRKA